MSVERSLLDVVNGKHDSKSSLLYWTAAVPVKTNHPCQSFTFRLVNHTCMYVSRVSTIKGMPLAHIAPALSPAAAVCLQVLASTDALANATTLLLVGTSSARLQEHLPNNQHVTRLHFGPRSPLFSYWVTASVYVTTAAAALLLLARQRQLYFQHRGKIALGLRLLRLVVQLATLSTPAASFNLAAAVLGRVHANPRKAPAMLVILPMAYYLQPAMLLLPWTLSAPIQLVSTCAMLYYMWQFPCYLQHVQDAGGYASTPAWQLRAELSCSRLQSYAAMVASAVGVSVSDFSAQVCEGTRSVQMLQIFGTLLCLLIGPVFATREWENWMAARCADHSPSRSGSSIDSISSSRTGRLGSGSSSGAASSSRAGQSSSGSSSSNGGSSSRRSAPNPPSGLPAGADILMQLADIGAQEGCLWRGVVLRVLVLALVLPVVGLFSEVLAEYFAATRDCPALLAAAGVGC
jgi:hypothetical protein